MWCARRGWTVMVLTGVRCQVSGVRCQACDSLSLRGRLCLPLKLSHHWEPPAGAVPKPSPRLVLECAMRCVLKNGVTALRYGRGSPHCVWSCLGRAPVMFGGLRKSSDFSVLSGWVGLLCWYQVGGTFKQHFQTDVFLFSGSPAERLGRL